MPSIDPHDAPPDGTDPPNVASDAAGPPDAFDTKRGTARFDDGALVLDASVVGYARSLYRGYWRSDVWWRKALFVGYVCWLVVALGWSGRLLTRLLTRRADLIWVAVGAGVVLALVVALRLLDYVRGYRSPDRLALDRVESVRATRGEKGLTRPRLVLTYRDGDATRKRRVNLPSRYLSHGDETYERAVAAFVERGFDVTADAAR
ncbi:hypothetical protein J2752_001539 [Halarchaeum rubridurum]|uniref:Uncharacterized protein n=1 Tax=Halarchaeum rubridurum TaxID=489911 RepID=A0A830FR01_9EURY|nr:hypothetical protein [Halarchaeum rubridurum]MBP1954627.1 hypothetical protein [Halarchaeum rubridurum]GGM62595.1 hypothetical protein GCM10009017_10870 [Halarchaeum rubridurum]